MKREAERSSGDPLKATLLELKQGRIYPCILIYGEDDYLVADALNRIIDALVPVADRELNLFPVDGEDADVGSLCETLLTSALFPGRKVVVVRRAPFFQSRVTSSDILVKAREVFAKDPLRAGRDFMTFLAVAGWSLDDLRDDGWKKIPDGEWSRAAGEEAGREREEWLPRIIAFCVEHGLRGRNAADDGDLLAETLQAGLPEGHVLILTAAGVDKRKRLVKIISEVGKIITFPQIKGDLKQKAQLMAASRGILAAAGKTLSERAWSLLGEKTGFDLRHSLSALEKLIVHAGERPLIDERDVIGLIGKTKEDTVFNLTGALTEKNMAASLNILEDLMSRGTQPLMILGMLTRELRLLLQAKALLMTGALGGYDAKMDYNAFQSRVYGRIKDMSASPGDGGQTLDIAGQHPYVVYLVFKNASRFSFPFLIEHLEQLAAADIQLKTSGRNPRFLLERFIIRFCA